MANLVYLLLEVGREVLFVLSRTLWNDRFMSVLNFSRSAFSSSCFSRLSSFFVFADTPTPIE